MKLLYITPFVEGAGGLQRILALKTDYLATNWNYEVHILATNSGVTNAYYDFNKKVKLYSEYVKGKNLMYLYNYSLITNKYIKLINPDIIIVTDNGFKGYCVPLMISKKHKIIFESHNSKFITLHKESFLRKKINLLKYKFYDFCIAKYDKCVIVAAAAKSEFKSINVVLIPNPVWFSTELLPEFQAKKAIAVGRHSYEKGFDRMLHIWQKVIQKFPDWELDIYGEMNPTIDLVQMSKSLKIENNINFYSPVKNINDKYQEASFCIMSSRFEAFGMVLIEAMASGLPCIAYDCPTGPNSIINNKSNGFLIENGNEQSFVDAIEALIKNELVRLEMGKNAKETSKKYNIINIMNSWNNLFKELKNK